MSLAWPPVKSVAAKQCLNLFVPDGDAKTENELCEDASSALDAWKALRTAST